MVAMDYSTWHGQRARDPRRLALGSAQWGMPYGIANRSGQPAPAEVAAMLTRAQAVGIHTIDTARAYGESERLIGALAPQDSGWRVVTKLAPDVLGDEPARARVTGAEEGAEERGGGLARPKASAEAEAEEASGAAPVGGALGLGEVLERVAASLEASRRALDRDVLPVLLLHRFAHRHACGGRVWRYLLAEREAGRIGALGVSAATPEQAWAALEDPDIEALQVATSLLDLRLHRQGFFARARELGRTVYVRSVFLQGLGHLEPEHLPAALVALAGPMEAIRQTAREMSVPTRALYLAFVRELPGVHPVVGCETEAQLAELLADWSSDAVDAAILMRLVESLPTHDAALVDPSCWPSIPTPAEHPPAQLNRAATRSLATFPW